MAAITRKISQMSDKFPVIVSSARPFDGSEYDIYQRRAMMSWQNVAHKRILVNDPEDIEQIGDIFVSPDGNPPSIKQLLKAGFDNTTSYVAIVNSDITLTDDVLKCLHIAKHWRGWAATSFRWEDGQVRGQGLDFFVMTMAIANRMIQDIPDFMTIGRGMWDGWMNGWLRTHVPQGKYFDMTNWRCVHHPLHERIAGRLSNYTDDQVNKILSAGHLSSDGIPTTTYG